MRTFLSNNFVIIFIIFLFNLLIQNWNLGLLVLPGSDEGVYLYSAKLLGQGFIPYKDFFLAHPPILLYFTHFILLISRYNIDIFHLIYTTLVFSSVFPIYLTTFKITNDRLAALLSIILFSTFPIFSQMDAHFLALRQMSIPLLAFSIFFLFRANYKLAGFLLGIFSLSIVSNILISISLITSFLLAWYFFHRQKTTYVFGFVFTYALVVVTGYILVFFISNSFENLVRYQLDRSFTPYIERINSVKSMFLSYNWPLLIFGFSGSILINKKFGTLGIFNILGLLCIVFFGSSFFQHYLVILSVGLSISSGILISFLSRNLLFKLLIGFIIIITLYKTSLVPLNTALIDNTTPEFFHIINILKQTSPPLFTFQPIYGLYSNKDLTFHYNVADMRYFMVLGKNLDEYSYADIVNRSNTVLIVPWDYLFLPKNILKNLNNQFKLIYDHEGSKIYVKNE